MTELAAVDAVEPEDTESVSGDRRRRVALAGLRLAVLLCLHVVVVAFHLRGDLERYQATSRLLALLVGAGFVATVVDLARLRAGAPSGLGDTLQLVVDQGLWSGLVYLSGGATSPATSLYALTCLAGAISLGRRGAVIAYVAALVFYVPLGFLLASGSLAPPADQPVFGHAPVGPTAYAMTSAMLGAGAVALLAASLADRLRSSAASLAGERARARRAEELALVGRLAAGLAHEIRNPIGSVRGCAEILGESSALSEQERSLLRVIVRETARLDDLVSDMLQLSRPREPSPIRVDLTELARDVAALARGSAEGRELVFEGASPAVVLVDADQFRQVLWNLVRNALQATVSGQRVWVRTAVRDRAVDVVVEDEGKGLPARPERIFDPAFSTRTQGTGIGLAVVKRVVDAHEPVGARIVAENRPGGGARFVLTIERAPFGDSDNLTQEPLP
jgi:two-component system, NtrC family, sensor histidine kinase HydH